MRSVLLLSAAFVLGSTAPCDAQSILNENWSVYGQQVCVGGAWMVRNLDNQNVPWIGQPFASGPNCTGRAMPWGEAAAAYNQLSAVLLAQISTSVASMAARDSMVLVYLKSIDSVGRANQKLIAEEVIAYSRYVRESITESFQRMPVAVTQDVAFKAALDALKADILKAVDARLAKRGGGGQE